VPAMSTLFTVHPFAPLQEGNQPNDQPKQKRR
jgi:hypothetical protein